MRAICASAVAFSLLAAAPAAGQTAFPQQTVRILVGFTAGTSPDIVARTNTSGFLVISEPPSAMPKKGSPSKTLWKLHASVKPNTLPAEGASTSRSAHFIAIS